ncbi:hypothetical protein [Sulfuritalea sp.]|uniref:hypothetical protein n=1 Tax=Sulfuritalea sp. TaxID=2480090 RepID=UPI00286E0445|nr:hypothetical protein [Sulfuritalea sp.]
MNTRRNFLAAMVASALAMAAGGALAAPPSVEIVAMPHPPVRMALAPLREWLAAQGGKLTVKEIDIESPLGEKRLAAAGLSGHIPILILIDGKHVFVRKDGGKVAFVNFPNIPGTPPGARGEWTTADVQTVLAGRIR